MTSPGFLHPVPFVRALALTLLFAGPVGAQTTPAKVDDRPVEDAAKYRLDVKANPALPTVYLVGDSTVRVGTKGQRGWGDELAPYFDPAKVNVVNHAIGGRSSRTFISEGRWAVSLAQMRKGDFVLIQFGHNDSGAINAEPPGSKMPLRARASLKGIGEETQEIDNVLTKQRELVHTYGWYLRKYVRDAKAKGVTPVICSLIPRKSWKDDTTMNRSRTGGFGGWAHEVADQEGALFIDLNDIIATGYEKLGRPNVDPLFADSGTHTTVEGAQFNARAVVAGLKGLPGDPFAPYLSAKARDIPASTAKKFTPAKSMIPRLVTRFSRPAILLLFGALAGAGALRAQLPPPGEDARPVVDASTVKNQAVAKNNLPTIFVVGDSTARSNAPLRGWGDEFAPFFDPTKINVVNRAIGGRSSRTFIAEGRWDNVLAETKPGDFMVVQFGHNDVGPVDVRGKFRGSLKGMGTETQDVLKPDGKTETVRTFGWYMTKYATDAKAKGVNVVIASPIPHKKWQNDFTDYRKWDAAAARAAGVPFIDVTAITSAVYGKLGPAKVEKLFADKGTHTSIEGAQINAQSVVAGLKGLPTHPVDAYLSAQGKAVPAATPAN